MQQTRLNAVALSSRVKISHCSSYFQPQQTKDPTIHSFSTYPSFFLWEKHPSSHIYPCKLIQQVTDKTRDKLKPSISYHHQVHKKRSCSRENNKCLGYIHRYIPHNHQKNFPMKDAQRHITLLVKSILFSA